MDQWPDSPWREYHVHDYGRYYELVSTIVRPFFESNLGPTFWHYIYHWEGGPHLRIRFGDANGNGDELLRRLQSYSNVANPDLPSLSADDYEVRARTLTAIEGLESVPPQAPRGATEVIDVHFEPLIDQFVNPAAGLRAFTESSRHAAQRTAGWGARVRILTETLLATMKRFNISPKRVASLYGDLAKQLSLREKEDRTVSNIVAYYDRGYVRTSFGQAYEAILPEEYKHPSKADQSALRFWHLHLNRLGFSIDEECLVAITVANVAAEA